MLPLTVESAFPEEAGLLAAGAFATPEDFGGEFTAFLGGIRENYDNSCAEIPISMEHPNACVEPAAGTAHGGKECDGGGGGEGGGGGGATAATCCSGWMQYSHTPATHTHKQRATVEHEVIATCCNCDLTVGVDNLLLYKYL
jgi:hypothetical protein